MRSTATETPSSARIAPYDLATLSKVRTVSGRRLQRGFPIWPTLFEVPPGDSVAFRAPGEPRWSVRREVSLAPHRERFKSLHGHWWISKSPEYLLGIGLLIKRSA